MSKHILSVSYDEPLLRTREMLLKRQGHAVSSVLGFTQAVELCKAGQFDLFILGHSIPISDKRELIQVFRSRSTASILALARQGESTPDGADAHAYPEDIEDLLTTVDRLLREPPRCDSRGGGGASQSSGRNRY